MSGHSRNTKIAAYIICFLVVYVMGTTIYQSHFAGMFVPDVEVDESGRTRVRRRPQLHRKKLDPSKVTYVLVLVEWLVAVCVCWDGPCPTRMCGILLIVQRPLVSKAHAYSLSLSPSLKCVISSGLTRLFMSIPFGNLAHDQYIIDDACTNIIQNRSGCDIRGLLDND